MSMLETSSRSLPEDLIMEILTRLPVKTLLRFKSASKSLLKLITRSDFVKLHLRRSCIQNSTLTLLRSVNTFASFDLDQPQRPFVQIDIHPAVIKLLDKFRYKNRGGFYLPKIIGICNGVVCFRNAEKFILYNPATRAYKQVPKPNASPDHSPFLYHDEFVYDCINDDFKIFRFERLKENYQMDSESYMYNLKEDSWSKIGNSPPGIRLHRSCNHIIASNYLYWLAYKMDLKAKVLVRFDVSSNTHEEMSLPTRVMSSLHLRLGVLNGRLHIITRRGDNSDIWMLKEDNCWTQVFCGLKWGNRAKHCLFYSMDGRKIFLRVEKSPRDLFCCDLDSQTTSVVEILGFPEDDTFRAIPWVESLVPLE